MNFVFRPFWGRLQKSLELLQINPPFLIFKLLKFKNCSILLFKDYEPMRLHKKESHNCHSELWRAALLHQRKVILQFDEIFVLSFSERGFSWFGAFLAASKRCIDFIKAKEKWQHKSFEIRTLEIEKKWRCSEGKMHHFALWKSW